MAGTRLYRPSTAALRLREESQRPLANKYKYSSVRVMIYSTPRYLCPRFQLSFTRTLESSFFNRLMPHLTGVGVENRRDLSVPHLCLVYFALTICYPFTSSH